MGSDVRVLRHAGRWRAPDATRARKGVRVRSLRITDSCNLVLAPPEILSMSDDQFTRAVGTLAEMVPDRAETLKGIPFNECS